VSLLRNKIAVAYFVSSNGNMKYN